VRELLFLAMNSKDTSFAKKLLSEDDIIEEILLSEDETDIEN
jgi:hypothetical protein